MPLLFLKNLKLINFHLSYLIDIFYKKSINKINENLLINYNNKLKYLFKYFKKNEKNNKIKGILYILNKIKKRLNSIKG